MNYPSGKKIMIGDYVWWDEKSATGHVVLICETRAEFEAVGMDEKGIWICYDGSISDTGSIVAYPERAFTQEGIDLIDETDVKKIQDVVKMAKASFKDTLDEFSVGVFFVLTVKSKFSWKVVFYKNGEAQHVVFVDEKTNVQ